MLGEFEMATATRAVQRIKSPNSLTFIWGNFLSLNSRIWSNPKQAGETLARNAGGKIIESCADCQLNTHALLARGSRAGCPFDSYVVVGLIPLSLWEGNHIVDSLEAG
jgi:hypothetical protein